MATADRAAPEGALAPYCCYHYCCACASCAMRSSTDCADSCTACSASSLWLTGARAGISNLSPAGSAGAAGAAGAAASASASSSSSGLQRRLLLVLLLLLRGLLRRPALLGLAAVDDLLLAAQAEGVGAVRVGAHGHGGEEVGEGGVAQVRRDLPEAQQLLERVLHEQARGDAHGGGQRGRTHALPLERALVHARGHHERRRALEARGLARHQQLDVPAHRVLAHAALHPLLLQLQAGLVHHHPRLVVVHAAQHQRPHQQLVPLHARDVRRVRLQLHVRVDLRQRPHRRVRLRHARVLRPEEQPSYSSSRPMPHRVSISAATEPTPPMPTTATAISRMRS
eukprot:scaffold292_cov376-Prasinococcus_capsulatus_cf.AAC.4